MTADAASRLAQECYDRAVSERLSTRVIARQLVSTQDRSLVEFLAVEFLVAEVQRAQRAATLEAERGSEVSVRAQHAEGLFPGRKPRKGTRAREEWESGTDEGRAWVAAEEAAWARSQQLLHGALKKALDRYSEDLKMKWTAELLNSTFTLRDGTVVTWGDATVDDHRSRQQMFLENAHANLEGAARHEAALRDLEASGATTLREMAGAAA